MKKKLFFAGAALLLAAAAVTGYSLRGESNLSALLDANVEALAGNEVTTSSCLGLWGTCMLPGGTISKAPAVEVKV